MAGIGHSHSSTPTRVWLATLLVAGTIASFGADNQPDASAATWTTRNGSSSLTAAPSCWAIRQSFPTSRSGQYWLLTAQLKTPQVFYCDMVTDGGGWVLIGRGRENWTFDWAGQGSASSVRMIPSGTKAFAPATVSSETVNALFAGRSFEYFGDGIRLRRSRDKAGTSWQEARMRTYALKSFTWEMDSGQSLKNVQFDSGSAANVGPSGSWRRQSTYNVQLDDQWRRVHTAPLAWHASKQGFAYGKAVKGTSGYASFLWSKTTGGSMAVPFTQVFVRPKVSDATAGFTSLPAAGRAAEVRSRIPSSIPQVSTWGVVNPTMPSTDPDPSGASAVYGLAQVNNTMFVGGKFSAVKHGRNGGTVSQPWLAAFDVNTMIWKQPFRPVLDGAVFDVAQAPNGKLIIAGNFTHVNGAPNTAGLAMLDPVTGAVDPGWSAKLSGTRFGSPRPYARAMMVQGDWVYVAGSFSKVTGGPTYNEVVVGGVSRVSAADGTPDPNWRVYTDGTPMDISPSSDGTRVYLAGFFESVGTLDASMAPSPGIAVLNVVDGSLVTGLGTPRFNVTTKFNQMAITQLNGMIFHGGNQKWLAQYDDQLNFRRSAKMALHGDIQALTAINGLLAVGCHCEGWSILDANHTRVDRIRWVGLFDPATMQRVPSFSPLWKTAATSEGAWELTADTAGCLWVGGDIIEGAAGAWLGGFARFCPGDTTAPTKPGSFRAKSTTTITWSTATDNSGSAPNYEIIRNDRVIAVVASTVRSYVVPTGGRYYVRAVDRAGNRSATTAVITR